MDQTGKNNVPLNGTIGALHIIRNGCFPESSNTKQTRKCIFEGTLPTPNILSKTDPRAHPWVKSEMTLELVPPHTNKLPKPHPMRLGNITRTN
jgi:hypothetical protein